MVNILLCGAGGKMGQAVINAVKTRDNVNIICGVDPFGAASAEFPVYESFSDVRETPDVIIDFSNPASFDDIKAYVEATKTPVVLCTTGFSDEQKEEMKKLSEVAPVFFSGNMSLGVNLLVELSKKAAAVLGSSFDIEIVEKHHNQKVDAPSGTAYMIADGISDVLKDEPQYVYDRHAYRMKRNKNEIGIHAVRGGTIVGEHEVIFAGNDEVLTITHQAQSKALFATGAISAAIYMADRDAGFYNMVDVLSDVL